MSEFKVTDMEGDELSVYHSGFRIDLCLQVNGEMVYVNEEETGRLRRWLNDLGAGRPTIPRSEPDDVDTGESPEQSARTSDADKLRILAAVIDAQAPLGTDLADFKRRLQIVLGA